MISNILGLIVAFLIILIIVKYSKAEDQMRIIYESELNTKVDTENVEANTPNISNE